MNFFCKPIFFYLIKSEQAINTVFILLIYLANHNNYDTTLVSLLFGAVVIPTSFFHFTEMFFPLLVPGLFSLNSSFLVLKLGR